MMMVVKPTLARCLVVIALAIVLSTMMMPAVASADGLTLFRHPTMSRQQIMFAYGGEIWAVARSGGDAHVLVGGMNPSSLPSLSPDGTMVAFSMMRDHNLDVYVVPATGGKWRRLTWHPGQDAVVGWTPDGRGILFRSGRHSHGGPNRLYVVPVEGGLPKELPLAMAESGSFSPDGKKLAYVPNSQWEKYWQNYKGGQYTRIWISRLSDSSTTRIPSHELNEDNPMWVGNKIYFLSTRDGPKTLFSYEVKGGKVKKLIDNTGFDITSASAGPGGIVYSQLGQLYIYRFKTHDIQRVNVAARGELPHAMARLVDVSGRLNHASVSENGEKVAFEANGDVLVVGTGRDGHATNITRSPGVMDRYPTWSPKNDKLAYFSDRGGRGYNLAIYSFTSHATKVVPLKQDNAYYRDLVWSPDGRKLIYSDQKNNLWIVNLAAPTAAGQEPKKITTASNPSFAIVHFHPSWSPDSNWVTFTEQLKNMMRGIFIYSLKNGAVTQVTHGAADCRSPVFGARGRNLYFLASTDAGPTMGYDLSTYGHSVKYHGYALALTQDIALQEARASESGAKGPVTVSSGDVAPISIEFDGILNRVKPLPIEPANYRRLVVAHDGTLYVTKAPPILNPYPQLRREVPKLQVLRYAPASNDVRVVLHGVTDFQMPRGGVKFLYEKKDKIFVSGGAGEDAVRVSTHGLKVKVVPAEEWAEMYHDVWRIERAFFYNPIYDGLDIKSAELGFEKYLPAVASQSDLTYLFRNMLSYIAASHVFVRAKRRGPHEQRDEGVGLLGAGFSDENGHYRISRILTSGRWHPDAYAPLAQPGVQAKVGDYLLAVNGTPVTDKRSVYAYFAGMAGKAVTLTIGPKPEMVSTHDVRVKCISSERKLRHIAWVEHNRELVNKLSGGKLGYVHMSDTSVQGLQSFNREFYAQRLKSGLILDERFNNGGLLSDHIIQQLQRKPRTLLVARWGERKQAVAPNAIIFGPKVLVMNEFSGSGGDLLPQYFEMSHSGVTVGQRTMGGLIAIFGYPSLMNGMQVTAPRVAIESLDGTFSGENYGISPDVKVWQDPQLVREGHDPQLDRAVKIAMQELKKHPVPKYQPAPWRDYHIRLPKPSQSGSSQSVH